LLVPPCLTRPQVLDRDMISYVEALRKEWRVPGLAVGVVRRDGTVETHGWGIRSSAGDLVTPETLFGIGSCTKAFIGVAAGLIQEKKIAAINAESPALTWRTPIKDILPCDWALRDNWASSEANLVDILSHQSGLPGHDFMYSSDDTTLAVTRRLRFLLPTCGLREGWQYNNVMFVVATEILNRYVGDFRLFIKNEVLEPLHMSSTTFSGQEAKKSGHLSDSWDGFSDRVVPYWFSEPDANFIHGAGGMVSSINDMTKWLKVILESLTGKEHSAPAISKVLKLTTQARTVSLRTAEYPEVSIQGYGIGWFRESFRGYERIHHYGSLPGVSAKISIFPDAGFAVVILTNIDQKDTFNQILENHLADQALGLDHIDWHHRWKFTPKPFRTVASYQPPIGLDAYSGTYENEGYGKIQFCLPSNNPDTGTACGKVQAAYNKVDASCNVSYTWQLQASWSRMWTSHSRLISLGGHLFLGQIASLFPEGYGEDNSPFVASAFEVAVRFTLDEDNKVTGFDLFMDAYEGNVPADKPTLATVHAHFVRSTGDEDDRICT